MKRTNRGFAVFTEFTDTYGARVRVQMSSAACARRCWVFTSGGGTLSARQKELAAESPMKPGSEIVSDSTAPHLSPAQARRLAKALLRFADGAE